MLVQKSLFSIVRRFGKLLFNFKSLLLPVLLTLVIELSIWINLAVPYFQGTTLHYISYLIISSVQLGATIDYAILFTSRYLEQRQKKGKFESAKNSIRLCTLSLLTSAGILTIAGIVLGKISTNLVLSQLGTLVGRGAVLSFGLVIVALPALLMIFDRPIEKLTMHTKFYKEAVGDESKQKRQ